MKKTPGKNSNPKTGPKPPAANKTSTPVVRQGKPLRKAEDTAEDIPESNDERFDKKEKTDDADRHNGSAGAFEGTENFRDDED